MGGIVAQHLRLSPVVAETFCFDPGVAPRTHGDAGPVGEINLQVGSVAAIVEDRAEVSAFPRALCIPS